MKSFKWRKEKPNKGWVYPTTREGHTITYISKHDMILLFGGLSNTRNNDLFLYDIKDNMWKNQATSGRSPSARCYHTAFYDEEQDNYYIYGGQGDKGRSMGDFYYLNMKNWIWKKLFIQEIPPTRFHHIFTEMNNGKRERVIFGGYIQPENQLLNDVWVFNYENLVSSSSLQDISGAKCTQITQVSGEIPSPRRGMTSFCSDRQLFIFGGMTNDRDEETNQLYCLNFDTWVWSKIKGIGQPPPSRSFLTCSIFTNRRVLFFGGVDNETNQATNEVVILTLNDNYWSSPFQAGIKASPRYNHSSCMVESSVNSDKYLLVLGGLSSVFCSMELCILYETETSENIEWEKVQEPSELDNQVGEKAGLQILDYNQQIDQLNQLISNEGLKAIQQNEEHEKLKQKELKIEEEHQQYVDNLNAELKGYQDGNQKCQDQMEDMFMMIKQEQIWCKTLTTKNKLLEFTLQKLQDYLMPLDQFYQQLQQNQFDEKDSKEIKLKQMVENAKDEINKSRDLHKESLYRLKKNYEKMSSSINKCDQDIEKNRKKIIENNKEYEQIMLETEMEENQFM